MVAQPQNDIVAQLVASVTSITSEVSGKLDNLESEHLVQVALEIAREDKEFRNRLRRIAFQDLQIASNKSNKTNQCPTEIKEMSESDLDVKLDSLTDEEWQILKDFIIFFSGV